MIATQKRKVDLLIGIPSYKEADNIAFVAGQIAMGVKKYFPGYSSLIINIDNHSPDNTREAFLSSATEDVPKKYISTEKGVVGKGNNILNLFKEAKRLEPKAVLVMDADLKSISPEWVKTLAEPILEGYDYTTPIYSRNEYDGTITNHICYPLICGLFQVNLRQPIGGDFSFSTEMAEYWLDLKWTNNTRQYGIDIFMTSTALLNGFTGCQVVLGSKVHKPSAPKLGPMFSQVVSTLFDNISLYKDHWMSRDTIKKSEVIGNCCHQNPQPLSIDYKEIKRKSMEGFSSKEKEIFAILTPSNYKEIKMMYDENCWDIDSKLWSQILYDFVYVYGKTRDNKDKEGVIESLKPLYFARATSFYRQTMEMDHLEAEKEIQKQAFRFQKNRHQIIKRF